MRSITVSDEHEIRASIDSVYECFWGAQLWPRITPHVKKIEMLEADERHQRMLMTVEANGRTHTVESVRETEPLKKITYRQTRPPVFLLEHYGQWDFEAEAGVVRILLAHHAVVDEDQAMAFLGAASADEAVETVRRTLKSNGERTIVAVKHYLESRADAAAGAA